MNKLKKYIVDNIPDPIKLIFFFSMAFGSGYILGNYGYQNINRLMLGVCEFY